MGGVEKVRKWEECSRFDLPCHWYYVEEGSIVNAGSYALKEMVGAHLVRIGLGLVYDWLWETGNKGYPASVGRLLGLFNTLGP